MAFKYPLVSNSSTLTIEELPAGDELVLDNLTVPGNASISGNANVGNLGTSGFITATGNITGGNINFGAGRVSGTGNVYASNFIGNISGNIDAAGSNTWVQFNDTGDLLGASAGFTFDKTSNAVVITGNVTGGNILTGGSISATGNISGAGNVNITGSLNTGNIFPLANATANIGSTTFSYNTIHAKATSAQYADLAENYTTDADYAPGTVVVFGGEQEITTTNQVADERVAGVISTNPAYLMNSGNPGLPVALRGKVPVQVVGPVNKGDSLVTSSTPGVAISVGRSREYAQAVFAKSLETDNCPGEKIIQAVIL
jgi:hypothetical protein